MALFPKKEGKHFRFAKRFSNENQDANFLCDFRFFHLFENKTKISKVRDLTLRNTKIC